MECVQECPLERDHVSGDCVCKANSHEVFYYNFYEDRYNS